MALRLAVLVSGGGSTMSNLLAMSAARTLDATVDLVVGSRTELPAEQRAKVGGVPYVVMSRKSFGSTESFSEAIFERCRQTRIDLVVCGGWLQMLHIPLQWSNRVINVHPSLLPSFGGKGMFGRHVHDAVLRHGCKVSGCTVHFVDNEYDNGPIICQRTCDVFDDDTAATLADRVQSTERIALPEAINQIAAGRISVSGRQVRLAGAFSRP
jgi:phosphoribosylglycinamide formyltransferase 1